MKHTYLFPVILSVFLVSACGDDKKKKDSDADVTEDNPFMKVSGLPYEAPDFEAINDDHFKPAIEEGIRKKQKEIDEVAANKDEPTFENTLVALEESGQDLSRVLNVFYLLTGAETNDILQEVDEEMSPKLSELNDALFLNDSIFQRVKTLYEHKDDLDIDQEDERLIDYYYTQFELAGANLSDDKKEELKKLNSENASLKTQFSKKLLAAGKSNALVVDDKEKLKGLSDSDIKSAKERAEDNDHEGYELSLDNTTQQPDLKKLENRDTREELFKKSIHRAEQSDGNDTRKTLKRLAQIRAKQAELLGYENYAEWNLQDQMAQTPDAAQELMQQIVPAATAKAKQEADDIQELIEESGEDFEMEPWDWNFYAEKVRKKKFDLDEDDIKPYFVLDSVLENGVFYAANKLYGLNFKERDDIPVYNDDVRVYEITEEDDATVGLFYADFFKRDGKRGGAWMSNIVGQSKLLDKKPVIYNVTNFNKPSEGDPALLSYDNVVTMFHEFGHALHGFFADQKYPSLSGTSVARDFVEFPSQFNEHWALESDVLDNYAKHYETGEVIPEELVNKIEQASTFNQGYSMTELLASAQLDMQWHLLPADENIEDAGEFEEEALKRTDLKLKQVPPRYRTSYFSHIWGSGYAAGYYAYIWTKVLDDDAYSWFGENGGMNRENGERFRDMILSKGNTEDYNEMFEAFRGHEPDIEPFLKSKGLVED